MLPELNPYMVFTKEKPYNSPENRPEHPRKNKTDDPAHERKNKADKPKNKSETFLDEPERQCDKFSQHKRSPFYFDVSLLTPSQFWPGGFALYCAQSLIKLPLGLVFLAAISRYGSNFSDWVKKSVALSQLCV
jgi:hypothetical protein